MAHRVPVVFVSHGAPTMIAESSSPTGSVLRQLGAQLLAQYHPRAVVVVSAHFEADPVRVLAPARHTTYHDHGFPDIFDFQYNAPGDPALGDDILRRLKAADIAALPEKRRGLDHGAFVPLGLMFPAADLPVVEVSMHRSYDPALHLRIGAALEPLRDDGVLLLGSGSATHNLRFMMSAMAGADGARGKPAWAADFERWLADTMALPAAARGARLAQWRAVPSARSAHPTDDHFVPALVVAGAASGDASAANVGRCVHAGALASLSLAAFQFDA
jgi:4,5-DOPA dioxygenase extradiol